MEIYETNDEVGIYFPERYILRTDWDTEYYEDLSQVLKIASEELKQDIRTKDELEEAIDDLDDWAFYEFKVVSWPNATMMNEERHFD